MRKSLSQFLRYGFLLLALLAAVAIFDFARWRGGIIKTLDADPDRRRLTTSLGAIEYAVAGQGVPLLALHGSPGGYDQSLANQRAVPDTAIPGVMTIAVSRPGFLGTPLESGATYQAQADLFAALLDELGIDRVIVSAGSAGGLPGLQFALRHPERTLGLILMSAGTMAEPASDDVPSDYSAFTSLLMDFAIWATVHLFPGALVKDFDDNNDDQAALLNALMATSVPWYRRQAGNRNEFIQYQDPAINDWPLEDIIVPTLILHGDADQFADYSHAVNAATRIPNAELVTFFGGDHFIYITRRHEVTDHLADFVARIVAGRE